MMQSTDSPESRRSLRQRIETTTQLPPMPEVAQALLRLSNNPQANAQDLVDIVEHDPSIAAQILRYARSAFFGYRGEILSLQQAITAVLGFRLSLDIAIGLSLGKTFHIPRIGPLGSHSFWQHAVYSAALCQRLALRATGPQRPHPGMAFLCGLLHNFGVLLVAYLCPQEAARLTRAIDTETERPVVDIEQELMGSDHQEIGAWLLHHWQLPDEIQVAVGEHHNLHYTGEHVGYAQLVLLSDRLLMCHAIGDAESDELPAMTLTALGLGEENAIEVLEGVLTCGPDLDLLVRQLSA